MVDLEELVCDSSLIFSNLYKPGQELWGPSSWSEEEILSYFWRQGILSCMNLTHTILFRCGLIKFNKDKLLSLPIRVNLNKSINSGKIL